MTSYLEIWSSGGRKSRSGKTGLENALTKSANDITLFKLQKKTASAQDNLFFNSLTPISPHYHKYFFSCLIGVTAALY